MPPLLEVHDLTVDYGHLRVLDGVSLNVEPGEPVALLGTNGAGKSTLLRAVVGLVPSSGGRVVYDGADQARRRPDERARAGLVLVEGGRATFPSLTVSESLRIGAYALLRRDRAEVERRVEEALALFPALRPLLDRNAGALSGGEQQMLALGRALVTRPRLLLVDELSLGLAPVVLQGIVAAVERLAAAGVALLLVEQSLNIALTVARRAYFLEKGEVGYSGPTAGLLERGDLVRSVFFGERPAVVPS